MRWLAYTILYFCICATPAHALSIDASALSSDETGQVVGNVDHIQPLYGKDGGPGGTLELSGTYAKTKGREDSWSAEIAQEFRFPGNVRLTDAYLYTDSHSSFAGALGYGFGPASVSAGSRVEYPDVGARNTWGILVGSLKLKRDVGFGTLALSARTEYLTDLDENRFDWKGSAKVQVARAYLALRFERVRDSRLRGISLGVSIF